MNAHQENPISEYLLNAMAAAHIAGKAILEVYEKKIEVDYKDDQSPLTEADRRSHDIISEYLLSRTKPSLPLLSEEGRDTPYDVRRKWDRFWMIDPLDGTKEFINRNGEFTVNIAVIDKNRPLLGVIYVPVQGVCYFAANGIGSYKLDDATRLEEIIGKTLPDAYRKRLVELIAYCEKLPAEKAATAPPVSATTIVGSRSHATAALESFVEDIKKTHGSVQFIPAGSSLKFCLVAEGRADIYPRLAPTMEWDTAAGQVIVERAGGSVLEFDSGEPLRYNKENLLNPWFVVKRS